MALAVCASRLSLSSDSWATCSLSLWTPISLWASQRRFWQRWTRNVNSLSACRFFGVQRHLTARVFAAPLLAVECVGTLLTHFLHAWIYLIFSCWIVSGIVFQNVRGRRPALPNGREVVKMSFRFIWTSMRDWRISFPWPLVLFSLTMVKELESTASTLFHRMNSREWIWLRPHDLCQM